MSARSPIETGPLPSRSTPTTPVPPTPRCTSMPSASSCLRHDVGGAVLLEPELRMGVEVAALRGQLGMVVLMRSIGFMDGSTEW